MMQRVRCGVTSYSLKIITTVSSWCRSIPLNTIKNFVPKVCFDRFSGKVYHMPTALVGPASPGLLSLGASQYNIPTGESEAVHLTRAFPSTRLPVTAPQQYCSDLYIA